MEQSARTRQQTLLMKRIHCLPGNIDWTPEYCRDSVTRPACSYWIHVRVCVCVYRGERSLRISSSWFESLLRKKSTMLYYTYAETVCEICIAVKWVNIHLSSVIFHNDTQRVVRCTHTVHSRGQLWSNDHGICTRRGLHHDLKRNGQAGTAVREYTLCCPGRRHPDPSVFWRLQQRLRETGTVTSPAQMNAGRPRTGLTPANEDTIIVPVERRPWRSSGDIA